MHPIRTLTSKIRMTELVKAHAETLTTERQTARGVEVRYSGGDFITFVVVPILVGLGVWLADIEAPKPDPLLAAVSILFGLLFALLILVFDQVKREAERPTPEAGNDPLVDSWQLLTNVSWAILVSTVLLGFMFGATLFTDEKLAAWLTGVVTCLFLHLLLTFLMILKRLFFMARRITGILLTGRR